MGLHTARAAAAFVALGFGVTACTSSELDYNSVSSAIVDPTDYVLPTLSALERSEIVQRYAWLDPDSMVPRGLLEDAIIFFDVNKAAIPKKASFVVVDFSRFSGRDRFWLVDIASGDVEPHKVAHGDGSDSDNDGYATSFGNVSGSHKSSLGFYLTGEIYDGTHPHSMRLDGLSPDGSLNGMANTNVRQRLIVVHEASYVDDDRTTAQGRSNGCLALDPAIELSVVNRIHDGTLIYAATSPLNTPVGLAVCGDAVCDGAEDESSCPADCADPIVDPGSGSGSGTEPEPEEDLGGCSTSPRGGGLVLALIVLGLRRRSRRA